MRSRGRAVFSTGPSEVQGQGNLEIKQGMDACQKWVRWLIWVVSIAGVGEQYAGRPSVSL